MGRIRLAASLWACMALVACEGSVGGAGDDPSPTAGNTANPAPSASGAGPAGPAGNDEPRTGAGPGTGSGSEGGSGSLTPTGSGSPNAGAGSDLGPPLQQGWTDLEPPAGAQVIHVSSAGSPNASGTESDPVSTIAAGYERLRDGQPDQLLLRRGDSFVLQETFLWRKSGPADPQAGYMRFGAYGDESLPRPVIDGGAGVGYEITPGYRSDRHVTSLAFTDIHFRASQRLENPAGAASATALATFAIEWQGSGGAPFQHLLFENLKIEGYSLGYNGVDDVEDLRFRRCVFTEISMPGGFASGILSTAQGLLIEENVFYRIQYPGMPGVPGDDLLSHAGYIGGDARDVVARGNIIIRATEGLMIRAGGAYTRNVSAHNLIGVQFGQSNGVTPTPGGVPATFRDNLILNARDGVVNIGNVVRGEIVGNLFVRDRDGDGDIHVQLYGRNAQGDGENIGVHDTAIDDNFVSGDFRYTADPNDTTSFSGLSVGTNTTLAGATDTSIGDYVSTMGLTGASIDDLGRALVGRDRVMFPVSLTATSIIDYYRTAVGFDPLP